MNIAVEALQAPTKDSLDVWLGAPRLPKCGEVFTPAEPMWKPDKSARLSVNWEAALACVSPDWQPWLHAALAYRMADQAADSVAQLASVLSRAAQAGLDPLNENHLIALRERFNGNESSTLGAFMAFWHDCESLEQRPPRPLIEAYQALPRKKGSSKDVVLSLAPEEGPFTQVEQDALHQWIHEQFCHGQLDPEQYLYLRLLMIYGQRGAQVRMMVFGDFTKTDQGCKVRFHWAKQKDDEAGWRTKSETFSLDEDLYNTVQAYKDMVLAQLWHIQTVPTGMQPLRMCRSFVGSWMMRQNFRSGLPPLFCWIAPCKKPSKRHRSRSFMLDQPRFGDGMSESSGWRAFRFRLAPISR